MLLGPGLVAVVVGFDPGAEEAPVESLEVFPRSVSFPSPGSGVGAPTCLRITKEGIDFPRMQLVSLSMIAILLQVFMTQRTSGIGLMATYWYWMVADTMLMCWAKE